MKLRKTCSDCDGEREASLRYFYATVFTKDGLEGQCKECRKKRAKKAYERKKAK